jgi:hypothetical protein
MQTVPSERPMPTPLLCSGCRHWEAVASPARSDAENIGIGVGRCGRFGETRPGAARPRCNICWEPAVVAPPAPAAPYPA